mgnify:CR=1 FL=1
MSTKKVNDILIKNSTSQAVKIILDMGEQKPTYQLHPQNVSPLKLEKVIEGASIVFPEGVLADISVRTKIVKSGCFGNRKKEYKNLTKQINKLTIPQNTLSIKIKKLSLVSK